MIQYITPKKFYHIDGDLNSLDKMMNNYVQILEKYTIDLACIGIAENGHLALNDKGIANFLMTVNL